MYYEPLEKSKIYEPLKKKQNIWTPKEIKRDIIITVLFLKMYREFIWNEEDEN